MLRFEQVVVRYAGVVAVDGADARVLPGEFVVLTGSNGSGKSSLGRAALGLVRLAAGAVLVHDRLAVTAADWRRRRREVAYVPQRTAIGAFPLHVDDLLASGGDARTARAAADRLGIGQLATRPLTTLSGGQLQRAYLARAVGALAAGAGALVADEPTSALDFEGQDHVAALLAELPVARLVISHDSAVVSRADRVLEMAGGRLRERPS